MGFAFNYLPFTDELHALEPMLSPALALGAQELHESEAAIALFARQHNYAGLDGQRGRHALRSLWRERYGLSAYHDVDLNDKADIHGDLSLKLPEDMLARWNVILDFGTSEHIFDILSLFRNIFALCRQQGIIVHMSPMTWHNHGFYNFTPKFFRAIIARNQCRMLLEGFYGRGSRQSREAGQGNENAGSAPDQPLARDRFYFTQKAGQVLSAKKILDGWLYAPTLPAEILYCVAYQKTSREPFKIPCDLLE
jgi:hypothetical protein